MLGAINTRAALVILAAALFLMVPALLNGFPFIFADSGDYLTLYPHIHRPPFYGLFITFAHLNRFIWMPVVLQSLLVSHLIWLLGKLVAPTLSSRQFLGMMAWLAAFSSLPYFTGFIMADIFTPIMFLCMVILAFYHQQLNPITRRYLVLLGCVATVTHITNLPLAMGMLILLAVLLWRAGVPLNYRKHSLALLATPITLTIVALLLYNGVIFKNWTLSSAGQSFFMANLIEYGPARTYLHEACPEAGYRICAYEKKLPATAEELLWFTDTYQRLGGFMAMREESAMIVKQTLLTRPMEVLTMVEENLLHGLMTHEPAAEFTTKYQIPSVEALIREKFGEPAVNAYLSSAEMRDTIPHRFIHTVDAILTPLAFFVLLAIGIANIAKRTEPSFLLPCTVICFLLGNTLLCTALSGVHDRYQSRVTWLLPMAIMLILFERRNRAHTVTP